MIASRETPDAAGSSPGGPTPARAGSSLSGKADHARENQLPVIIPTGAPGAHIPPAADRAAGSYSAPGASVQLVKVQGRTMDEWIAQARADLAAAKRPRQYVAALYAAAAAQRHGAGIGDCPFDPLMEQPLAHEWNNYFRVAAQALHREKPGTGAAGEYARRTYRTRHITTTSAAYAEQMGGVVIKEDGE